MGKLFLTALAFSVAVLVQEDTPGAAALQRGIHQYGEGLLSEAIVSLDEAIARLPSGPSSKVDLGRAWVFKGAALVGLMQEQPARQAFLGALSIDATLRLRKGEFPDRVIRVFEAARTGSEKSVMERPSTAPKKAGISAAGIAAIAGGALLLAGGAVVATGGDPGAPAAPAPSPTPDANASVMPITGSGPGTITFVSAVPPPGSTLNGCSTGCAQSSCAGVMICGCGSQMSFVFDVRSDGPWTNQALKVELLDANGEPRYSRVSSSFNLSAGQPFRTTVTNLLTFGGNRECIASPPLRIMRLIAVVGPPGGGSGVIRETFAREFTFAYTINR